MPTEAIRARVVRLRRQPGLQVIADRHETRPFVRITEPAFAVAALAVLALTRIIDVRGFGVIMIGGIISLLKQESMDFPQASLKNYDIKCCTRNSGDILRFRPAFYGGAAFSKPRGGRGATRLRCRCCPLLPELFHETMQIYCAISQAGAMFVDRPGPFRRERRS
jgi:hypothetical protein